MKARAGHDKDMDCKMIHILKHFKIMELSGRFWSFPSGLRGYPRCRYRVRLG